MAIMSLYLKSAVADGSEHIYGVHMYALRMSGTPLNTVVLDEKRYFLAKSTQNATFKRCLEKSKCPLGKKQVSPCFFRAAPTNPWGPAQFWIHSRNARQPSGSVDNTVLRLSPAKRGRLSAKQYRCVETEKFRDTPNPRGMFGGVRRGA